MALPMSRMITGIIHRTAADTTDTWDGLFKSLKQVILGMEITVEHQIHQLWLNILRRVKNKDALPRTGHVACLGMSRTTTGEDKNAGVGIVHRTEMLLESLNSLLVNQHLIKVLGYEHSVMICSLQALITGNTLPNITVSATKRMTEIIYKVATLTQLFNKHWLSAVLPATGYIYILDISYSFVVSMMPLAE